MSAQTTLMVQDLLSPDCILAGLQREDRDTVVKALLTCLAASGRIASGQIDAAWAAIQERESKGATAIGGGLAVPHARVPFVEEPVAGFAVLTQGTGFHSIDAAPVHYVFLMLSPETQPTLHLHALSQVSRFFRNENFVRALTASRTAAEIHAAFQL